MFSCVALLLTLTAGAVSVQEPAKLDTIILSAPQMDKGLTVMQALSARKSQRDFTNEPLTRQQLSELLWAANGVNRPDGKRTAPAAVDVQTVDIYVLMPEGVYRYDAPGLRLLPVAAGDYRKAAGRQEFAVNAPVNLIFVLDRAKFSGLPPGAGKTPDDTRISWAYVNAGCQAQNAALYCASEGLGGVVRAGFPAEELGQALNLTPEQMPLLAFTVGRPKTK
ncbi:MAG TPA: SagB/ThcOx family dehydrogenase [bacterium]|nr:SagB/ThcOx family dehydrogenase [bacterium]